MLFHKYGGANVDLTNFMSHFSMFFPIYTTVKWLMETLDIPKEWGIFYVTFLNIPLYIRWDQVIIIQFTLPTPSHQVPSNVLLVFKVLHLNLSNIVVLSPLKVILKDHPNIIKNIYTIFKLNLSNLTIRETGIL